jgi:hypothetical protein
MTAEQLEFRRIYFKKQRNPMTRDVGDSFLIRAHPRKSAVKILYPPF